MNHYKQFTRLFPVQKTLRMGLIPVGQTQANIETQGVMDADRIQKENSTHVKQMLDNYHKHFMDKVLSTFRFDAEDLALYIEALQASVHNSTPAVRETLQKVGGSLCRAIGQAFASHPDFPLMWKKEMFTVLLPGFVTSEEERNIITLFQGSLGYFTDYMTTRKLLYEGKPLVGSVACRLVSDNLPIHVRNIQTWQRFMASPAGENLPQLCKDCGMGDIAALFTADGYGKILVAQGIDIYNGIIGGAAAKDGNKIKGLNEYVNLYNQQVPAESRLPFFVKLKKMLLSERVPLSWLPDKFEDDNALLTAVAECYDMVSSSFDDIYDMFASVDAASLGGIHIGAKKMSAASVALSGKWSVWRDALVDAERGGVRITSRMTDETVREKCLVLFKKRYTFSLGQVADALDNSQDTTGTADKLASKLKGLFGGDDKDKTVQLQILRRMAGEWLDFSYPENRRLIADGKGIAAIKNLMDGLMNLKDILSWFVPAPEGAPVNEPFYNRLAMVTENIQPVTALYNKVRNYLTRKPYSTEKLQLNFGYGTFMGGWDADKDVSYGTFIARRNGDMYLGVLRKGSKIALPYVDGAGDTYDRIYYKQISGAFRMMPKVFFSGKWLASAKVPVPDGMVDKYTRKLHLKGDSFDKAFCHQLIDYFKACISQYDAWSCFDFHFTDTARYEDISQFYNEVENQAYHIGWLPMDACMIDRMVEKGDIYLFRIYNRDLSPAATGRKQLQTLYYQMLFDERNLSDLVYKLNGGACLYFRKKSLDVTRPTHPAGEPIANKNPLAEKKFSTFSYDLVKDRRYTVDKFEFHFPVTINACCNTGVSLNRMVNRFIRETPDLHVIGINRGEHNLVYVTVIDSRGQIVEQKSLNLIAAEHKGTTHVTDWQQALDRRAGERQDERKNWQSVKEIATLKQGYVSQAVHEVVGLLGRYKAVIAIEDLDGAFKNSRRMVEKEIYAQFEDALVSKLSFYVDKTRDAGEPGGLLYGLQLALPAEDVTYAKQNGIVFKVPTWYFSMTCPATGFINFLQPVYKNVQAAKDFICRFDGIVYNDKEDRFEWSFDYRNFTDKVKAGRTQWTLCTTGKRFDDAAKTTVQLTGEYHALLKSKGIDIYGDLKKDILAQDDRAFFERLMHLLKLTLKMRNAGDGGDDYLVSPVMGADGSVWCSDAGKAGMPVCGDANDAYNIARRGLMYVRMIAGAEEEVVKLNMSLDDWLRFVQKQGN